MAYVTQGNLVVTQTTTLPFHQPAMSSGQYAVAHVRMSADYSPSGSTPPSIPGWIVAHRGPYDGAGTNVGYWRYATSAVSSGTINVTVPPGGAISRVTVMSGWINAAPTVLENDNGGAVSYWQSAELTVTTPREAVHNTLVFAVRTAGTISNQGTIVSANTSRGAWGNVLDAYRHVTVTSAITSATNGRVRQTFTTGNAGAYTVSFLQPVPPPPVPSGVSAVGGEKVISGEFESASGATAFRGQWRRTDLVRPATTTQSSAPNHLRRISQENLPMPSGYTYDFTGDGVPYAQFDTGVRVTHNEFGGRYVTGGSIAGPWNTDTAANPPFTQGHGTGVAAMALGTTYGVAKEAILYSVNAGEEDGPTMDEYEASAAWLIANKPAGKTVALNISNGFPLDDIPRLEAFLDSLYLNGIAVFVAAGNTGEEAPYNDLQYRIFVVGASTQADVKASYSNYGDGIDLYAPISPTTTAGNQSNTATRTGDGTSEAAPTAAGVALKILEGNPELAPWRLYEVLRSQAWEGKISGIPTGTNLLLNGNANTDEWSEFPVSGETFTLDGLDSNATYEVRFSQMVGGEWSDWSTADSATTLAPGQYALPEVVGTTTGGRVGDGSFNVTPPAGADYWIALVAAGHEAVTAPSGWTLVKSWAEDGTSPTSDPGYWLFESTGSPGSSWSYAPSSATNPIAVLVRGYTGVTGTALMDQHSATSPAATATDEARCVRVVFDLNDSTSPLGYPTEASLNRAQVSRPNGTNEWSASIGIAEQEVTAGATGTAAWTVPAQYEPHALTILLYGETDPPGPLSQIAAFKVEVATSNTITVPIGSGAGASMQEGDLLVIAVQWANNGTASPGISWGGTTPTTGLTNRVPWSSPSSGSISSGVWTWPVQSGTTSLTLTFAGTPDDGNVEVIVLRNWEGVSVASDAWSAASEAGAPPSRSTPSILSVPAGSLVYAGIDMASGSEAVTAVGGTIILDGGERNGVVAAYGATTSNGTVTSKTFTWPTSGAYRVRSWQLAVQPAPSLTVMYANVGATTDSGFTVAVKTLNAETVQVRAGGITGAAATVDSNGWAHASVSGLNPLTSYSYDLILDGSVTFNNWGTTKTWPTPGTPTSFGFAFASCFNPTTISGTDEGSFDRILARNPLLWIHGGDYHYEDNTSTSTASHIADMEESMAYSAGLRALHSAAPVLYSPGDHDYGGNNAFQGAWTPATRSAKLAVIPFHDRPDPTALYHSVVVGRVRFIILDTRSLAVVDTQKLGAAQMEWLEGELLESEPVKVVWVDNSWLDTRPTDPGDDTWQHFNSERLEIAGYIENAVGQVIIIHGDQHALAADDGSGNPWGGVPVIGGAPFKQFSSHKVANPTADYSEGVWPTSEDVGVEQYMWCDVIDSGGTEITLDFSGRDTGDVERISLSVVAEVPVAPTSPWRLKGGTVVYPFLKTSGGLVPLV